MNTPNDGAVSGRDYLESRLAALMEHITSMRAHIDSVMAELIEFAKGHAELFADGDMLNDDPAYASFPFG